MIGNQWQLQEAKNKFSKLVDEAQQKGPQFVTRHGKEAVVVLSADEYKKLVKPKSDLVGFFRASPLVDQQINIDRSKEVPRDIKL